MSSMSLLARISFGSTWRQMIAVFVMAVTVPILAWAILPATLYESQGTDYLNYYEPVARNIAQGKGIVINGALATKFPPAFPFLLAALFRIASWLRVSESYLLAGFSLLCAGLTALFVFLLAANVWNPRWAYFSTLIWITYPLSVDLFVVGVAGKPLSEILFLPLLYGTIFLFVDTIAKQSHFKVRYLFIGLLLGFLMLVRPIAIGLPLVFTAVLWWHFSQKSRSIRLTFVAILFLGMFAVVLPWVGAIYQDTGRLVPLSTVGTSNVVDGLTSFAVRAKTYRRVVSVPDDVKALMYRILDRQHEMDSLIDVVSVMEDEFKQEPMAVIKLFVIKSLRSWYATDSGRYERWILLLQIVYLLPVVWGGIRAWRKSDSVRQLLSTIWLTTLYFWTMNTAVLPVVRYSVPSMGLLFLCIPGISMYSRDGYSHATIAPERGIKT